jgi:phosphoribosylanthranilate isomerase
VEQRVKTLGRALTVGVFMNQDRDTINRIALEADLDFIQLHGSEGYSIAQYLCRPVIRVIHIPAAEAVDVNALIAEIKPGFVSLLLLDTAVKGGQSGGLGKKFDWKVAAAVAQQLPVLVAGGLTPVNVRDSIAVVHTSSIAVKDAPVWVPGQCFGVDVSSGTETDGSKDLSKITAFVTHSLTEAIVE